MSKKMMVYAPKNGWDYDFDATVNIICDEFFEYFGAKLTKSSVKFISVFEKHEFYEGGDYETVTYITFHVRIVSTGRKYRYVLCYNSGEIEKG